MVVEKTILITKLLDRGFELLLRKASSKCYLIDVEISGGWDNAITYKQQVNGNTLEEALESLILKIEKDGPLDIE